MRKHFFILIVLSLIFSSCSKATSNATSATINGKTYKTIIIGTQTWIAENLNDTSSTSYCYFNNPDTCTKYGRFYDWDAAKEIDAKIGGWHIPTSVEWTTLGTYLGGENIAGEKMRVAGTSGFNVLYAGNLNGDGIPAGFGSVGFGYSADFWSSSPSESGYWIWSVKRLDPTLSHFSSNGFINARLSVRLIKD